MSRVLIFAHLPQAAPLLAFGSISLGANEANRRCECMVQVGALFSVAHAHASRTYCNHECEFEVCLHA